MAIDPELANLSSSNPSSTMQDLLPKGWSQLSSQEQDSKLKYYEEVRANDGKVVKIPPEAINEDIKQWEKCLVGCSWEVLLIFAS